MHQYVRTKKIKDVETPSETLLFPMHPSNYSRGNTTAIPENVSTFESEPVSDIRLN